MSESKAIKSEINNNLNTYLNKFNITAPKIIHNPSYEALFTLETDQNLPDTEKTKLTELNAVTIDTGKDSETTSDSKTITVKPAIINITAGKDFTCAILEKDNAVLDFRKLIGSTDPSEAKEGTIRKLYADSKAENAIHGSDSGENAKIEINFHFSKNELF